MTQDWRHYVLTDRQIRELEKQQKRAASPTQAWDSYEFIVSPTCPPSTSIFFRGGMAWWSSQDTYGRGFYIPSYEVDLADSTKTSVRVAYSGYTTTFTNAYWYVGFAIFLAAAGLAAREEWPATVPNQSVYLSTDYTFPYYREFETAAEAEEDLMDVNLQRGSDYGIPAGGVILRNNGVTGKENQYMPIDRVNRGRSYLFWRARNGWSWR